MSVSVPRFVTDYLNPLCSSTPIHAVCISIGTLFFVIPDVDDSVRVFNFSESIFEQFMMFLPINPL